MSYELKPELNINNNDDVIDIDDTYKNLKSVDDLNFTEFHKMGRGKTPNDIQEKCLNLCKQYLAGSWAQQTVDSIEVRRITGGVVNQIYYCGLIEPDHSGKVPQEVAIRFFGNVVDKEDKQRIRDMVISLTFSEKGIGPKIYGIFEGGWIQKYYKHRLFHGEDQKDQALISVVFRTLAQIHSLEVPIKKKCQTIYGRLDGLYEEALKKHPISKLIDEYNCETLKKYDLRTELNWVKEIIDKVKSPVIFTHYDYRSSNLMITEPNDELVVCDYDISGYGSRGYDFVSLMREWGRPQVELKSIEGIPFGSEFQPFIEIYVEECQRIHGKSWSQNPINSVDHILKEAKIFLMISYLFMTITPFKGRKEEEKDKKKEEIKKEKKEQEPSKFMMELANMSYKNYQQVKEILSEQKLFD